VPELKDSSRGGEGPRVWESQARATRFRRLPV